MHFFVKGNLKFYRSDFTGSYFWVEFLITLRRLKPTFHLGIKPFKL